LIGKEETSNPFKSSPRRTQRGERTLKQARSDKRALFPNRFVHQMGHFEPLSSSHSYFCPNLLILLPRAEPPCAENPTTDGRVDWQSQKWLDLSRYPISGLNQQVGQ